MISVWGTPIVATVEQVIKDLKLERFDEGLLREINNTGSDLMCTCPFHKGGKENKPSCGVLLREKVDKNRKYEAGTVHCYTCGYTGDLPQFVADFLGLTSPVQGFKWLVSRYNYSSAEREPLELNLYRGQAEKASYMDEAEVERFYQELKKSSTALEYLKRRALPSWIIDAYKLGFDPEDGVVLFPVRDMSGKVAFYKGRSLVGKHFYNAKDIDKTSQIFGLYELLAEGKASPESEIWITESEIDALSLIGQERLAIALMGSHMQKYVKVRSTAREVLPLEIDEYHVILNSGITEIHEPPSDEDMDGGFDGWEIAEQIIYDKDEYIKVITEKSNSLEEQATNLQLALVDVYEMML